VAFIGGKLGYWLLRRSYPEPPAGVCDGAVYNGRSKLEMLLGPAIWERIHDRVVVDFGCGTGNDAIELARHGAATVIGIDIRENVLALARDTAQRLGVTNAIFRTTPGGKVDVIVSLDSFEHFADPASVLDTMASMLKPGGCVLASFGPTWYHPLGGHLFSVFPWAHLVFTENSLIRWRSDFKSDGATRFREVAGGLNQMSIRRFRRLVSVSPLRFASFEAVPIRRVRFLHNRITQEFFSSVIRCTLVLR